MIYNLLWRCMRILQRETVFLFFFHAKKIMLNIKLIRLNVFTCTEARHSLILEIFQQSNNQSRAILFFAGIEITHFDHVRNYLDHFRGTKYINILRNQVFGICTLRPSIFKTGVHPPSPHPKSPMWQRTETGLESTIRVTTLLISALFYEKQ